MKSNILICLLVVSAWSIAAPAQNSRSGDIRKAVIADPNMAAGLDGLYDFSPKASTPAPKGYEAVYISHYGRHGSRYAYTEKTYTTVLNLLSEGRRCANLTPFGEKLLNELQPFWDNARYRVGDLTPTGWDQHRKIAGILVKSFPSAFGKGSKVDACSSASVRSIISMSSFCNAVSLAAPKVEVYEHQGIMDIQATRPNMGGNPFRYQGPAIPFPYPEDSEAFFLRHMPGYANVLARLFKDPEKGMCGMNAHDIFFYLYMFVAGMNSLPEDEKLDLTGLLTPEEFATLWETDNYERFREYLPYCTSCFSIIDDMISKADAALSEGSRGAHLRFGHDHVLMSLMMDMDLEGSGSFAPDADDLIQSFRTFLSPMATNIQMVFFCPKKKNGGPVLVKVLLNGSEASLGDLSPVSGPYYSWEAVKSFLLARKSLFVTHTLDEGWSSTEIGPGLVYRHFSGIDPVSGSAQQVYVADWDMNVPGYALKFTSSFPTSITSDVMKEYGATIAMNACYETPSVVVKVDGELLSNMPNNTIMTTGVPNWKSDGAVYTDGQRGVRISWDGKDRTPSELRAFYASSTAPNIFTSAPMLIDDFEPVGETFAGFYSADAIKGFNYEDYRRHQGVRHPRTAVAITSDNHFLMVVVDGRRTGVCEGMTARELTRYLRANFNPRYALNMDGGGSSTLCVEGLGDPKTHVVNYPTDNKRYDHAGERSIPTHFCIVRQ